MAWSRSQKLHSLTPKLRTGTLKAFSRKKTSNYSPNKFAFKITGSGNLGQDFHIKTDEGSFVLKESFIWQNGPR